MKFSLVIMSVFAILLSPALLSKETHAQQKSGLSYTVIGDDPKPSEMTTLQIKTVKPETQNTEQQDDAEMEARLEQVWKKYHALAAGTEAPNATSENAPEGKNAAPAPAAEPSSAPPPTSINGILQNHQHNKKRAASMRTLTVDHGADE